METLTEKTNDSEYNIQYEWSSVQIRAIFVVQLLQSDFFMIICQLLRRVIHTKRNSLNPLYTKIITPKKEKHFSCVLFYFRL